MSIRRDSSSIIAKSSVRVGPEELTVFSKFRLFFDAEFCRPLYKFGKVALQGDLPECGLQIGASDVDLTISSLRLTRERSVKQELRVLEPATLNTPDVDSVLDRV